MKRILLLLSFLALFIEAKAQTPTYPLRYSVFFDSVGVQHTSTIPTKKLAITGDLNDAIIKFTTLSQSGITDVYTKTQSDALYPLLSGSYSNPSWITALPWNKITGTPTTVAGYNISDALSTANISTYTPAVLSIVSGINAKTVGSTLIYTVPSGKIAVITGAIVRCTSATSITTGPVADIGVTAGDIYPSTAITALTNTTKTFGYSTVGMSTQPGAGSLINFNINTGAVGTSQTLEISLLGYLR